MGHWICAIYIMMTSIIKRKHFPRYWQFVRGIHRSPVNSPHKGQWHGALMFSLICTRINSWVNNDGAGDLRRYRTHYDVTVMFWSHLIAGWSRVREWKRAFRENFRWILLDDLWKIQQHWYRYRLGYRIVTAVTQFLDALLKKWRSALSISRGHFLQRTHWTPIVLTVTKLFLIMLIKWIW